MSFALALALFGHACSCGDAGSDKDAGPTEDAGVLPPDASDPDGDTPDASDPDGDTPDGAVADGYLLIHRNVAGGSQAESENYRMIRTQSRGNAAAGAHDFSRLDAVQGAHKP